jgi:hypothetical protein
MSGTKIVRVIASASMAIAIDDEAQASHSSFPAWNQSISFQVQTHLPEPKPSSSQVYKRPKLMFCHQFIVTSNTSQIYTLHTYIYIHIKKQNVKKLGVRANISGKDADFFIAIVNGTIAQQSSDL